MSDDERGPFRIVPGPKYAVPPYGTPERELYEALLSLSDTLDPEEGPVILAWATPVLAKALLDKLAERGVAVTRVPA